MSRLETTFRITDNGIVNSDGDPARVAQLGKHRIIIKGTFDSASIAATEYSTTTGDSGIAVSGFPLTVDGAVIVDSPFYQLTTTGSTGSTDVDVVITPIIVRDRGV